MLCSDVVFLIVGWTIYSTVGVIGVDCTLDEIEFKMARYQWGSVYSFLINKEGETIFHPLMKPSSNVSNQ